MIRSAARLGFAFAFCRVVLLAGLLLIAFNGFHADFGTVRAQSACPQLENWTIHWAKDSTVYFSFDSTWASQTSEKQQVEAAIAAWNSANATNGSNITLKPADATHASTLTLTIGQISTPQRVGEIQAQATNNIITTATITFDLTEKFPNGTPIYDPSKPGGGTFVKETALNEIGHGMGLGDALCDSTKPNCGWAAQSVMNGYCGQNDSGNCQPSTVAPCDNEDVKSVHIPSGGCGGGSDCYDQVSCLECDPVTCQCTVWNDHSPILITVGNSANYPLVGPLNGVSFDLTADGVAERIGWTAPGSAVGFLALDRNANGLVDDGSELFGTNTPIGPAASAVHGFDALAFYDRPENGGNSDGFIDFGDAIWPALLLWIDGNHDGISQHIEQTLLAQTGLTRIELEAHLQNRRDAHGNLFRYKAKVWFGHQVRMAYDVFFASRPRHSARTKN